MKLQIILDLELSYHINSPPLGKPSHLLVRQEVVELVERQLQNLLLISPFK